MNLSDLGWNSQWEFKANAFLKEGWTPARVIAEHKDRYELISADGEIDAEVSGRFRFNADRRQDFPAVGDWVMIDPVEPDFAVIQAVVPRKTKLSRKDKLRESEEQILAANVDVVFVVTSANEEFNLRRIERYLVTVRESGARPVVVINKADLVTDLSDHLAHASRLCNAVVAISAFLKESFESLSPFLEPGETAALIGSSGVGKSTIINRWLGNRIQPTAPLRKIMDKGRHTTTHRELFIMSNGRLLIDTPGMREIQLWAEDDAVSDAFEDIAELADQCRFRDCKHEAEPGCAVKKALENGLLETKRYNNYVKMMKEIAFLKRRQDPAAARLAKEKRKKITAEIKKIYKERKKR